jgi:hypothetical protein
LQLASREPKIGGPDGHVSLGDLQQAEYPNTMNSRTLIVSIFATGLAFSLATVCFAEREVKIFNGKDLKGWTKRGGAATYKVEDGVIVGRSAPNTSNTFLCTDDEYGDFTLELEFKMDSKDGFNSGVQIRSHARPEGDQERVYGYQVEMDTNPDRAWTGGIYFEGGSKDKEGGWIRKGGWLNELGENKKAQKARKLDDWNHFKIVCNGRTIKTWLNGVPAADFTDHDKKAFAAKGFIALQVHGVGDLKEPREVRWKNIKLTVPR